MKIIAFITGSSVVAKILRHCGLLREPVQSSSRLPPFAIPPPFQEPELVLDHYFFESTCA